MVQDVWKARRSGTSSARRPLWPAAKSPAASSVPGAGAASRLAEIATSEGKCRSADTTTGMRFRRKGRRRKRRPNRRGVCRTRRRSAPRWRAARSRWPPTSPSTSPRARRASCCVPTHPATASRCVRLISRGIPAPACRRATPRTRRVCRCVLGPGASKRDVHPGLLQLTAQRLAEGVHERLRRRISGVVRDR